MKMKTVRISLLVPIFFFSCLAINFVSAQKNPYFVGNRSTIVHLFEWNWLDIAKECEEFLGPKGYGGVQISPPNEYRIITSSKAVRPWWERYQPISYILKSRSGNETELRHMIARCNRSGVRVYVDAIINHMIGADPGKNIGTAGSVANYDKMEFPAVPYGPQDFNTPCVISDYSNAREVRDCQLNSLLDLNQTRPHVREVIVNYMNRLLEMGVAGFRVDAAKHMWPHNLNAIYSQLRNLNRNFNFPANARPFIYQEVIDLGGEAIKSTDYTHLGVVTEFRHSAEIGRAFRGGNQLRWLINWGPQWGFLPSGDAIVFVDNHDNQRGHGAGGAEVLTHKNSKQYKLATIFMLAHPYGRVTRVMSSYTFDSTDQGPPTTSRNGDHIKPPTFSTDGLCDTSNSGWVCEHRWPEIVNMVEFRNLVGLDSPVDKWWDNGGNQVAFSRGHRGFVALNNDVDNEMKVTVKTGLPKGRYCNIINVGSGSKSSGSGGNRSAKCADGGHLEVDDEGKIHVYLPKGPSAMATHVNAVLHTSQNRRRKH